MTTARAIKGRSPENAAKPGAAGSTLINLQVCRGLAAGMVVYAHSLQEANAIAGRTNLAALQSDVDWGFGVHLFFVISGFIMIYISVRDFAMPGAPWYFFVRRLMRIVPLYWLLTTAVLLGAAVVPGLLNVPIGGIGSIVKSYLFIPDWRSDGLAMRPVLALGWTLNYEMLFYLLFALALNFKRGLGVALLSAILTGGVFAHSLFHLPGVIGFWTDPIVLEFLVGTYIALVYQAGLRLPRAAAVALLLLGVTTLIFQSRLAGYTNGIKELQVGIPAAVLVGAATLGPQLAKIRLVRFGIWLGDASYALYLVHPFVLRPLRELWLALDLGLLPLQLYCAVAVLGSILVAFALHAAVEKPVVRALHRTVPEPTLS